MARITIFLLLLVSPFVNAAPRVVTALVHSAETYILDQDNTSLQEYGVGDTIYLVLESSKKRKGFYRVTFDPTNLQGDGWVSSGKIRILSNYKSTDGKLPTSYKKQYVAQDVPLSQQSDEDLLSGELTFIDELVSQEQSTLETSMLNDVVQTAPQSASKGEENPFEEDLEFLFTEDEDFQDTFETAKNDHTARGVQQIAIASFSQPGDKFAQNLNDKFSAKLNAKMNFEKVVNMQHVDNIDTLTDVVRVDVPSAVSGVLYGTLSSKAGNRRLLKLKYYDPRLKQFMYEKVVSLPTGNGLDASIAQLVTEVASFLQAQ